MCVVFLMIGALLANPYGLLWWPSHRYVQLANEKDMENNVYIFVFCCLIVQTAILTFYGTFSTKTTRCLAQLCASVQELGICFLFLFGFFTYHVFCETHYKKT